MISAERLTKYYGATRAVDDVSFTVEKGAVVALLGRNGSGKSTVMRMLTGYFSPTAGRVRIGDVDVAEQPLVARRRIGYLPEQVAIYPELTVQRYLHFVGEVKGLRGRRRRAAVGAVMDRCGLAEVAGTLTGRLSKGYRQRVGLAQALLADPEVLVLDEPTVGLDPLQTHEMNAFIRTLAGCTVLLSTHVLSEATALCSRVIILAHGHLVAEDSVSGLQRHLAGVERLDVRVDGPPDEVASVLGALPGVTRVERGAPDGQAGHSFGVLALQLAPVQRAVAGAVVGRGWTLLEMRATTPTLEDLFVRLVGQDREAAA